MYQHRRPYSLRHDTLKTNQGELEHRQYVADDVLVINTNRQDQIKENFANKMGDI